MLVAAYSGAYVVNQKQIERCCATSMCNFAVAILKLGSDVYDKRGYMEAEEFEKYEFVASKNTEIVREALLKRNKVPDEAKFSVETFASKSSVNATMKAMKSYYMSTQKEDKISDKIAEATVIGIRALDKSVYKGEPYATGSIASVLKEYKNYKSEAATRKIDSKLRDEIDKLQNSIKKLNKEESKKYINAIVELRQCSAMI
jgi:hypothetical protein